MSEKTISRNDTTLSLNLQSKGKRLIPGLTQLLSKRPDQFAPGVWPGYYSKASGASVWDLDGNRYLDMSIGGIGANVLGYADPDVDNAVKNVIDLGASSSLNCPEEVNLAELLCEIHPWAEMVRYARTGGEAMAVAVRIARAASRRDKIAFCGYHGWHDWYLAANLGSENALGEHLIPGLAPAGVPKALAGSALPFRYNHPQELSKILDDNSGEIGAVIMEPIRSEQPEDGFLDKVKEMAHRSGAVFVLDEISAGFRMNTGGAHLTLGVTPDIAVFSKAISNGYPMAAILGRRNVMEAAQSTFISSTNWTERIGPTAALATINKHRRLDVGQHLMSIGQNVQRGWRRIAERHGLDISVGGIPPLSHFSFLNDEPMCAKALFVELMLRKGILASTSFYAMYAHTDEHVSCYLDAADEVLGEMAQLQKSGELASALSGPPATAGFKRLA